MPTSGERRQYRNITLLGGAHAAQVAPTTLKEPMNDSQRRFPLYLVTFLIAACGSSSQGPSDAAGGSGGGTSGNATNGGTSGNGMTAGTSGTTIGKCADLARCCVTLNDRATCQLAVDEGNEAACATALAVYAPRCPRVADPSGYGATPDNWEYFPGSDGVGSHVSDFAHLFITNSGTALGTGVHDLYRSTDRGVTWHATSPSAGSETFVVGEAADHALFAKVNALTAGGEPRIAVSKDDGIQWQVISDAPFKTVTDVFVRSQGGTYVLAEGRVLITVDGGTTWTPITEIVPDFVDKDARLLVDSHETLHVFAYDEHWRLNPNDRRWFSQPLMKGEGVRILPDDTLVLATRSGLFRSITYGEDWVPVEGVEDVLELAFKDDSGLLYGRGNKIQVSPDQGVSWQPLGPEGPTRFISFAVLSGDIVLANEYGVGGKFYRSPTVAVQRDPATVSPPPRPASCYDGARNGTETGQDCGGDCGECQLWERLPSLSNASYVRFVSSKNEFYGWSDEENSALVSNDTGHTWQSLGAAHLVPFYEHADLLYASGSDAGRKPVLMVSSDRGRNWTQLSTEPLASTPTQLLASATPDSWLMAAASRIYTSSDAGGSWISVHDFGTDLKVVSFVELSAANLFAIVGDRAGGQVYRTAGDLTAWSLVNVGPAASMIARAGVLYIGVPTEGVLKSEDGGQSFSLVRGTVPEPYAPFALNSVGTVLLGDQHGVISCNPSGAVLRKNKGGQPWSPFVLSDDRVLSGNYLSGSSVDW